MELKHRSEKIALSLAIATAIVFAFFGVSIPLGEYRSAKDALKVSESQQEDYKGEAYYDYMQRQRLQDNFWLKLPKWLLVVFCILAGLIGAAVGCGSVWFFYKLYGWSVLAFRSAVDVYDEQKSKEEVYGDVRGIERSRMIWVKCKNPDCEVVYQIDKKDYFKYVQEHRNALSLSAPSLVCEKCGEESVYRAVRCQKCGLIFSIGSVAGDFSDKCPQCGYSKQARQSRRT